MPLYGRPIKVAGAPTEQYWDALEGAAVNMSSGAV